MNHVTAFLYTAGSVPLVPGLFCGFDIYSGIMEDIPAARYRERVARSGRGWRIQRPFFGSPPLRTPSRGMSLKSPPVLRPQPMSDVSWRGFFGGRPSDILNLLGLDNPVRGCRSVGSILEASRSWQTAYVCVPDM